MDSFDNNVREVEQRRQVRRPAAGVMSGQRSKQFPAGQNRRIFQPLFLDRADINEVYRNIDRQKFSILPAVPQIHLQRSEKSLPNVRRDFLFPSPELKPISAVPRVQSEKFEQNNAVVINEVINDNVPQTINTIPEQSSEARKKFKRCHGRCVQKFCLPVGNLHKHEQCQDSCRDICEV